MKLMKQYYFILLLLFPMTCFSQIKKIGVQVIDITHGTDLGLSFDSVILRVGKQNQNTINRQQVNSYSRLTDYQKYNDFYDVDYVYTFKNLDDTIYISHPDYKFDTIPMSHYDFDFVDDAVILKVYAKPNYNFYHSYDFNIAKSKKMKNDTLVLNAFCSGYGENPEFLFYPKGSKHGYPFEKSKNDKNFYQQTFLYDELTDGEFRVKHQAGVDIFHFKANEWYQTIYLVPNKAQKPSQREERFIKSYFDYVRKSQLKISSIEKRFSNEKDSLISVIDSLRGYVNPPPPKVPRPETLYIINQENAEPVSGFTSFFKKMELDLPSSIKYSGNITLEVEVMRDGRVRTTILHAMQDSRDILDIIKRTLRKSGIWKVATRRRKYNQKIILSLNFTQDKG